MRHAKTVAELYGLLGRGVQLTPGGLLSAPVARNIYLVSDVPTAHRAIE